MINIDFVNITCSETASVLYLEFKLCIHFKEGTKLITSVKDSTTFTYVLKSYQDCQHKTETEFKVSAQGMTSIYGSLPVG